MSDDNRKWMIMGGGVLAVAAAAAVWFSQNGLSSSTSDVDNATAAAGFDDADTAAVEAIVRDYILKNPEIIPEAVEILQKRQKATAINAVREEIEEPFAGKAWAGNPNGDVTIVEFSDFSCPYCKSTTADLDRLLQEDKNVKVVFRELPILSEASNEAALMALAAAKQDKYYAFHKAMFDTGRPNNENIETAARKAGVDLAQARAFIASPEAEAELQKNLETARSLQFTGTPAWIIGDDTAIGAVGYDGLQEMVAAARGQQ